MFASSSKRAFSSTSAVTDFTRPFTLFSSRSVPPGTPVIITATATDGAGNTSGVDTLIMATGNVPPPVVSTVTCTKIGMSDFASARAILAALT